MLPRRRHPFWFEVVVAAALAVSLRQLAPWTDPPGPPGGDTSPPLLAFWPLVALVASAIWKGLEVAGRITLEVLRWSVLQLWSFARNTYNAAIGVGKALVTAARRTWDFFEATYEYVLKPAWQYFWRWFDRARRWLEDVLRPVFRFLRYIRQWVLDFYAKYVRPILDVLAIAQKVLRVLQTLGFDWARKLDQQLAELQRRIDAPFRFALEKINQVINLVNRVVTADGLIQRVALVRSIERDIRQVSRAFVNWRSRPVTDEELQRLRELARAKTYEQVTENATALLRDDAGPYKPFVDEMAAIGARILTAR